MKTALAIVQEFRRGINLSAPSTLVSLTDPDELQVLELLYETLEYIRSEGPFRTQIRSYDITTDGTANYSLPEDWWEAIPNTDFNEDSQYPLIGPVSDAEFVYYKERGLSSPYEYIWRVVGFDDTISSVEGANIEFFPTPGSGETLSIEYASGNLFIPASWFASPDTTIHETVAANSDYCAFDADLVKLGLRYHFFENKDGFEAKAEKERRKFMKRLKSARFRHEGPKSGVFGATKRRQWFPIQERGFQFS